MSENGEKYWSLFPKAQGDVLKILVLSTTQKYLVYCAGTLTFLVYLVYLGLPENIHIWETKIREFGHFSLKNDNN